jgi:uncharacterized protein involved in response to NO
LSGFARFPGWPFLSGLSLPVLWALLLAGVIPAPASSYSMVQWHAHEMFFGFGWAVLGRVSADLNQELGEGAWLPREFAGVSGCRLAVRTYRHVV